MRILNRQIFVFYECLFFRSLSLTIFVCLILLIADRHAATKYFPIEFDATTKERIKSRKMYRQQQQSQKNRVFENEECWRGKRREQGTVQARKNKVMQINNAKACLKFERHTLTHAENACKPNKPSLVSFYSRINDLMPLCSILVPFPSDFIGIVLNDFNVRALFNFFSVLCVWLCMSVLYGFCDIRFAVNLWKILHRARRQQCPIEDECVRKSNHHHTTVAQSKILNLLLLIRYHFVTHVFRAATVNTHTLTHDLMLSIIYSWMCFFSVVPRFFPAIFSAEKKELKAIIECCAMIWCYSIDIHKMTIIVNK